MKLRTIINSLNEFFFKPQPVYSVALLRIGFGILILISWFGFWNNLEVLWGEEGILSLATSLKLVDPWRLNLFALLPEVSWAPVLLCILLLLGALGMIMGFFTRTSIAITYLVLLSFHNRNPYVLNSADIVIRNFLFLLLFSPCGEVFSLDAWLKRDRASTGSETLRRSPWALRLMQIQFSVIYVSTVLFKMKGQAWADGTAVYFATRLDEFVRVPLGLLNNILIIKFLTWSTLVVEFFLGTLVWVREFRYWVLLAGVFLHLGIELTMSIPLFEWVMICSMICVVDSEDLQKIFLRMKSFKIKGLVRFVYKFARHAN